MSKNLCVYCKSPAFGPGCPFSPNKVHFHAGDPKRCCYCGSVASGPGCPFNPHSKVHVHGIEFNSMVKDSIDKSITLGYLKNELSKPITEMKAYKLGIVDKNGRRIKDPETPEELSSYSCLEKYIIGIKQNLGKNIELINSTLDIQLEAFSSLNDYPEICEAKLTLEEKLTSIGEELTEAIANAYNAGLSTSIVEKILIDSILEK